MQDVNWTALIIFVAAVRLHHLARLRRRALAQGRPRPAARMGARRPALRHHRHLVPGRRRPLHRLHLHRRSGARLRRRRRRVLRGALHDRDLSDPVPGVSAALARLPQARLHHARRDFVRGRFGNRWLALAVTDHRHRRHHALHRPAAGRPAGRHRRAGRLRHRLCRPICRWSSPSSFWPPSPIRAGCARRRRSPSSRTS